MKENPEALVMHKDIYLKKHPKKSVHNEKESKKLFLKNEKSPVISTKAELIDKTTHTHTYTNADGIMNTHETFTLIFKLDTGSELTFSVNRYIYRSI